MRCCSRNKISIATEFENCVESSWCFLATFIWHWHRISSVSFNCLVSAAWTVSINQTNSPLHEVRSWVRGYLKATRNQRLWATLRSWRTSTRLTRCLTRVANIVVCCSRLAQNELNWRDAGFASLWDNLWLKCKKWGTDQLNFSYLMVGRGQLLAQNFLLRTAFPFLHWCTLGLDGLPQFQWPLCLLDWIKVLRFRLSAHQGAKLWRL